MEPSHAAAQFLKESAALGAVKKLSVLEKDGQAIQLVLKGDVCTEKRTVTHDLTEAEVGFVKAQG